MKGGRYVFNFERAIQSGDSYTYTTWAKGQNIDLRQVFEGYVVGDIFYIYPIRRDGSFFGNAHVDGRLFGEFVSKPLVAEDWL